YGYHPAKQLHQETVMGKRCIDGKTFYKVRQQLTKLSNKMVQNIYSEDIKKAIEEWIEANGGLESAKATIEEKPFIFRGNVVTAVSVRMTVNDLPYLRHKSGAKIHPKSKEGEPVDFVYSETNYALQITEDNGKLNKCLITLLEHVDNLNKGTA